MLAALHIENIAVIRTADLTFGPGFTVLTGETGAGKSMILAAIQLLLGARVRRELIRTGEEQAMVSGLFCDLAPETCRELELLGITPDEDGSLLLQRNITADGRSVVRVGGRQISMQLGREAGRRLLSVHGQHENQRLLDPAEHIGYLDRYAETSEALAAYGVLYEKLTSLRRELNATAQNAMERERLMEMYRFQLEDIDAAHLRPGEEEELEERRNRLRYAEKIAKQVRLIVRALQGGDKGAGACDLIARSASAFAQLGSVLPEADEYAERLETIRYELESAADAAASFCEDDGGDPDALLDKVESRLDTITRLKRKYGADCEEILAYRRKTAEALAALENADETAEKLRREIAKAEAAAEAAAGTLSELRQRAGARFAASVTAELRELEMPKARFEVAQTRGELGKLGRDTVEFLFTANVGEPARPLDKIASGGELSRVMLACKSILADREATETLIFDEIDTGVSGRTAESIGGKLRAISRGCQVLCVTHSAQIAAQADQHLAVRKTERDGRVETSVSALDEADRVNELSRIMGGAVITEKLRATAAEMRNRYAGC